MKDIRQERDGEIIEKTQIRSSIQMLIEVCKNSRKLYEQEFEKVLLQETAEYYKLESQQLITDSSFAAYLEKSHKRLMQEYERIANYLDQSTEPKLISAFLNEYIGDAHSETLLTSSTGLVHMIRNNNMEELALVYNMFQRRQASFELLRKHLAEFIVAEGSKLVSEEVKNDDLVVKMIDLRERVSGIQSKAMEKDVHIDMTIKMAFEKVVNVDNRTAKALVFYLDEMLKKDFKNINEAELTERLDKVIHIFRYLTDKDVFEGFYVNSFAKRLLEQRQICEDAETALVLKLKEECGCQFTQRLEVMFKDMKMSDELCQEFKSSPTSQGLEIDFSVKVITQGQWPNDKKETQFFQQIP